MKLYKFGAIFNILVLSLVALGYALMHYYDSFYFFIEDHVIKPLGISSGAFDDLFFNGHMLGFDYVGPSLVIFTLLVLFLLVGVSPLLHIRFLVKSNLEVRLIYFTFVALLSLGIGGGLFMFMGLVTLRSGIYKQRDFLDEQYYYPYDYEYVSEPDYYEDEPEADYVYESEQFLDGPSYDQRGSANSFVKNLKQRIWNLERENARIEENAYFNEQRQNRHIENLELDLASERRRSRYYQ